MGRSKKPSRKADVQKALANLEQYRNHQIKVNTNPGSMAIEHWKREKQNFKSRMEFYLARARVNLDDVVDEEHSGTA